MKKRAPKSRGYLSQLAQPLLPGQPALVVRPGTFVRTGAAQTAAPAIEDSIEIAPRPTARPRKPQPPAQGPDLREPLAILRDDSPVESESPVVTLSPSASDSVPSPVPALRATLDAPARHLPQPGQVAPPVIEHPLDAAPIDRTATPPTSHTPAQVPGITQTVFASSPRQESATLAQSSPAAGSQPSPPAAPATPEPIPPAAPLPMAGNPHMEPPESAPAWRPAPDTGRPAEAASAPRRQVRIGTIEIRTTQPQPAQPIVPPALQRPADSRAGLPNGQSGERLGRGLAWTFGLVQG